MRPAEKHRWMIELHGERQSAYHATQGTTEDAFVAAEASEAEAKFHVLRIVMTRGRALTRTKPRRSV